SDAFTIISTRVINCPTSGYVLAIASVEFGFSHVNGASSVYNLWLSQSTTQPTGHQKNIVWPSTYPTGTVRMIVSVNHIFSVGSGNQTVNIVTDRGTGDPTYFVDDKTLSLIFIPTAYGTVTTVPPAGEENENEATDGGSN
ncbi:MAG: hypothetical protein IIB00_09755, partial [candidate division Zixibacteria bacterium]|nr:hypothetical protein [candidate division Zixibacteria bacterium]